MHKDPGARWKVALIAAAAMAGSMLPAAYAQTDTAAPLEAPRAKLGEDWFPIYGKHKWPSPGHNTDHHVDENLYQATLTLLPKYRFPDPVASYRAVRHSGSNIFRDQRAEQYFKTHAILVADGILELEQDPRHVQWMGTSKPVGVSNLPPARALLSQAQKDGLVMLGALTHWGHYALINTNNDDLKPIAKNIAHQLAEITPQTRLTDVVDAFKSVEGQVDTLKGGWGPHMDKWVTATNRLTRYVQENYGVDGLWYYALGADAAGLWWLALGQDDWQWPQYKNLAENLLVFQPQVHPHNRAAGHLAQIVNHSRRKQDWVSWFSRHSKYLLEDYFPR